jgi:hypothetical protein
MRDILVLRRRVLEDWQSVGDPQAALRAIYMYAVIWICCQFESD